MKGNTSVGKISLRMLMIPDWSLGGWGYPWHHGSWYVIIYLCAKFQLSSMIWSVSRTPCPRSHTWRMLKVSDWSLGGWGHLDKTTMKLSWKFREDLTSFGGGVKGLYRHCAAVSQNTPSVVPKLPPLQVRSLGNTECLWDLGGIWIHNLPAPCLPS